MTEMQFSAMVLMSLLAVTLIVLLPRRVMTEPVLNRSRWLMVGGTALVAVQFLLQYTFGFRQMGVTQAVMVNLLFFVPCSCLFSLAILCRLSIGRCFDRQPVDALGRICCCAFLLSDAVILYLPAYPK